MKGIKELVGLQIDVPLVFSQPNGLKSSQLLIFGHLQSQIAFRIRAHRQGNFRLDPCFYNGWFANVEITFAGTIKKSSWKLAIKCGGVRVKTIKTLKFVQACALTAAAMFSYGVNSSTGEPLQGRIEHKHRLPPVSRLLKPGIHYNDNANKPQSNAWVRVPSWLAGTWLVKQETAVFREIFSTGERSNEHRTFQAKNQFSYGKQVDKTGQIWHYIGVPYTSDTQISGQTEYHQVLEKELTQLNDHKVAVRSKVVVIKVRKSDGEIAETYQQESFAWYTDNPDGSISLESSTKAFDADGMPVSVTQNRAHISRGAKFTVINEEYGKNLKSLFRQYLLAQGLNSLVPD